MERYENLRNLRDQARALQSRINLAKIDFEDADLVEYAADSVEEAVRFLNNALEGGS